MLVIPLQPVPAQIINVQLSGQNCQIKIFQTSQGLFCDLYVSNALIVGGVICQNLNRVVRDSYLGFVGDLFFQDSQGSSDPDYLGLGNRYVFCYLETSDLATIEN